MTSIDSAYSYSQTREQSLIDILSTYKVSDKNLLKAIGALGEATTHCAQILSNYVNHTYAGTQNKSGDDQLHLDIDCDNAVFLALRQSKVFGIAASEETPVETSVCDEDKGDDDGSGYFDIGFDPLDGSSIIEANFSVGSIYGIWPRDAGKKGVLNRTGREQIASAMALYGPRTTLCIALTSNARGGSGTEGEDVDVEIPIVLEVTLVNEKKYWNVSREKITIQPDGKYFAPGNLRASNDNSQYFSLIQNWIEQRYTLRYTGGMVPDVYHILSKSKGVFSNVSSTKAKAKLRLLYEVAPIGLIIECAGGSTTHESYDSSVLDEVIDDLDKRLGVCFGSRNEVSTFKDFMFQKIE